MVASVRIRMPTAVVEVPLGRGLAWCHACDGECREATLNLQVGRMMAMAQSTETKCRAMLLAWRDRARDELQ